MDRQTSAVRIPLHPDVSLLAQCRRRLLCQTHQKASQARRVPIPPRTQRRHPPLPRRRQRKPKALYLDQGPQQNHRSRQTRAPSVRFDPLDTDRRELRRDSDLVAVEPQVFDILEYLIRHRDRVVSRDDLIASVWGGRIVSESALSTRINAVRSAIGDDGESQRLIRTLPRKGFRFLGEVREVEEEEQSRARRAAALPSGVSAALAPRVEAERRHLTVVSCDVVGLRDLATRLDPEELRNVIGACHACCHQVAARWDGTVARFADDGATIHFSYPQAHEDDAERAVRAGLDLIARIKRLETGRSIALATRIGIATGLVVLGELSGASGN